MDTESTRIILPDPDIEWVHNNRTRLRGEYGNKWIAVKEQAVVAANDDAGKLIAELERLDIIGALVTEVRSKGEDEGHYLIG